MEYKYPKCGIQAFITVGSTTKLYREKHKDTERLYMVNFNVGICLEKCLMLFGIEKLM